MFEYGITRRYLVCVERKQMSLLVEERVCEVIIAFCIQDIDMQNPFMGIFKRGTDRGQVIALTIRKDKKSGDMRPLFGWNDGHKVIPNFFVRGAVILHAFQIGGYRAVVRSRDSVA